VRSDVAELGHRHVRLHRQHLRDPLPRHRWPLASGVLGLPRHDSWTPYARPSERDAVALTLTGLPSFNFTSGGQLGVCAVGAPWPSPCYTVFVRPHRQRTVSGWCGRVQGPSFAPPPRSWGCVSPSRPRTVRSNCFTGDTGGHGGYSAGSTASRLDLMRRPVAHIRSPFGSWIALCRMLSLAQACGLRSGRWPRSWTQRRERTCFCCGCGLHAAAR
jgi:hypothetical protein